jgi:glycosyltransferase involved in cell wall biosynthesis
MKLAILAHSLRVAGGLAVGKNFIRMLKQASPEHTYLFLVPAGLGYEQIGLPKNSTLVLYKGTHSPVARVLYDLRVVPGIIRDFNADVVFGMGNAGLKNISVKQAVLVQDSHMLYDEQHYRNERFMGKIKWRYQKYRMKKCLNDIDMIFCQTPIAKSRFAEVFHYPSDKIELMPNAVSEFALQPDNKPKVPDILKKSGFFNLFYLAKFYAHKNFEILIDLFRKNRTALEDVRCFVTISPDQHKNATKFLDAIQKYELQDHIVNMGPLSQEQLAEYFLHCDGLLFPTLLESFSGTYLEAMHFGLPIMTSDLDFARYICDDSALYFNPWDADDIARTILELKNNPKLRQKLICKGKKRVGVFFKSWNEITTEVMKKLEKLYQDG